MSETPHAANRGIDHLVLAVRDLDAAAARYAALGFTLTPRAAHPWGTANRLVQLDGSFLELLAVAEPALIVPHGERRFSFGAWNRDWLTVREGCSMLVFEGHDHRAERDAFAASGVLRDLEPFEFERTATLPDGSQRKVAFSLAFAIADTAPALAMFTCRQHAPELFWKAEYQSHANGARCVVEVVVVADRPNEVAPVLAAVQGDDAVQRFDDERVRVATARGSVAIVAPSAFAADYGAPPAADAPAGAHFAACRIGVVNLAAVETLLAANGVVSRWAPAGLTVPAEELHGLTLAFAQL